MPTADHAPSGGHDPVVDALWKAHRRRMLDIAFRILPDQGDGEDVVQEAFSRCPALTTPRPTIPRPPSSWSSPAGCAAISHTRGCGFSPVIDR
jgi:DNA-directed RNA polymerase specialized sigma24 family protein